MKLPTAKCLTCSKPVEYTLRRKAGTYSGDMTFSCDHGSPEMRQILFASVCDQVEYNPMLYPAVWQKEET